MIELVAMWAWDTAVRDMRQKNWQVVRMSGLTKCLVRGVLEGAKMQSKFGRV